MNYFDEIKLKDEIISLRAELKAAKSVIDSFADLKQELKDAKREMRVLERLVLGNPTETTRVLGEYIKLLKLGSDLSWHFGGRVIESGLSLNVRRNLWSQAKKMMATYTL